MVTEKPLILTLRLDSASHAFFTTKRAQQFPPALNHLEAHITLFHHLPGPARPQIESDLQFLTSHQPTFPLQVIGLRSLGRGVAYTLESKQLEAVRAGLAERWAQHLTRQDQQKFQPHITVQNKVSSEQARQALTALTQTFQPRTCQAEGLDLWQYEGGPWTHLKTYGFMAHR